MNRLRIYIWAATGSALAGLGWLPLAVPANASAEMLSRSAGLALLGIVLVSTGLVFRAAMRAERQPVPVTIRARASEYRRGFGARVGPAKVHSESAVVVALRRAVEEQGKVPTAIEAGARLPIAEIERLHDTLRDRARETVARNGHMAKRPFLRSGADPHGLAPQ